VSGKIRKYRTGLYSGITFGDGKSSAIQRIYVTFSTSSYVRN